MHHYELKEINTVSLPQFQNWTDEPGMMTDNDSGNSTGNGNLFMAHYVFGLYVNNMLIASEKARITQVYLNNMREPGLLNRLPGANDWRQAHDDMIGLMGADALMNPNRADRALTRMVYQYGKSVKTIGIDLTETSPQKVKQNTWGYRILKVLGLGNIKWVWNNVKPGLFDGSSWLGRRMEVIATMQMSVNKWLVNPIYYLYWAVSMLLLVYAPGDKSYRDGYTLRFHSALACEGFGPITNWICKKVRTAVARDYQDFGNLLGMYFAKPQHPIVAFCKDKF